MGNGIAQAGLMAEYKVSMHDVERRLIDCGLNAIKESLPKFVDKRTITEGRNRDMVTLLPITTDLKSAVTDADLVIEAVFKNLELKKRIFKDLDAHAPANAVLASNTSSMSITAIAAAVSRPEQVVALLQPGCSVQASGGHLYRTVVRRSHPDHL